MILSCGTCSCPFVRLFSVFLSLILLRRMVEKLQRGGKTESRGGKTESRGGKTAHRPLFIALEALQRRNVAVSQCRIRCSLMSGKRRM